MNEMEVVILTHDVGIVFTTTNVRRRVFSALETSGELGGDAIIRTYFLCFIAFFRVFLCFFLL